MFSIWENWLGIQDQTAQDTHEHDSSTGDTLEVNKPPDTERGGQPQLLQQVKGLSGYLINFASSATKKLSDSVVGTAQILKRSVEEGNIATVIDKTILGDFQKEQERFVEEKHAKDCDAAVPPWVGYNDEDSVQEQILALSIDQRNFLRDPPAGVNFNFDFEQLLPVAMVMLEEDELLRKMRFHLVPKQLKEEVFWRNYFYRVSLIKQSAQLTALTAQQGPEKKENLNTSENAQEKDAAQRKPPSVGSTKTENTEQHEEYAASSPVPEFVSDAFDSCNLNEDDLRREMQQLVLAVTPDWERELHEELQEFDIFSDNQDYHWDQEIEMMLKDDS